MEIYIVIISGRPNINIQNVCDSKFFEECPSLHKSQHHKHFHILGTNPLKHFLTFPYISVIDSILKGLRDMPVQQKYKVNHRCNLKFSRRHVKKAKTDKSQTKLILIMYFIYLNIAKILAFPVPYSSDDKESACNAEDLGWIPRSGRCPGEGNGNPLQYSCLENSMGRVAWWATVLGSQKVRHD